MDFIKDLKDLKALLKLCHAQGVKEIKLGAIELKLGDLPQAPSSQSYEAQAQVDPSDPYANFPTGELTPEQLMYYSSGGIPGEEPEGLN